MDDVILRASFLAADSTMLAGIDQAIQHLAEKYAGPQVSPAHVQHLKKALQDKIESLNAALALYFTAHSDPNKIKYHLAMNSMDSINQLISDIPTDALVLSSSIDLTARKKLLDNMQILLEGVRKLCTLNISNERDMVLQKMHEECYKYTNIANILLFTLTGKKDPKKDNQVLKLAWEVDDSSSFLLRKANVLRRQRSADQKAESLESAIQSFMAATRNLLICTDLATVTVHNTHYRSAISAAYEQLTSCLNQLSAVWKTLVEDRYHLTYELHQYEANIHRTLKNLNKAVLDEGPVGESQPVQEQQNLDQTHMFEELQNETNKPGASAVSITRRHLMQRLTQLNAAVAMFTHVPQSICNNHTENTDNMRELAINLISQLTEQIFADRRVVSGFRDEDLSSNLINQKIINLCDITKDMITNNHSQVILEDYARKVYQTSCELVFLVYPEKKMEIQIVDKSAELRNIASKTKSHFSEAAQSLVNKRNRFEINARNLLALGQITAPSVSEACCRNILLSAVEELRESFKELIAATPPHLTHVYTQLELNETLENNLQFLSQSLHNIGDDVNSVSSAKHAIEQQHFIKTLVNIKMYMLEAKQLVNKRRLSEEIEEPASGELQQLLVEKLAQINAAFAELLLSFGGRNCEYTMAQRAVNIIAELMPQITQDVCELREVNDYYGIQELFQQLCGAVWTICDVRQTVDTDNAGPTEVLGEAAVKLGEVSKDLISLLIPSFDHTTLKKVSHLTEVSYNNTLTLQYLVKTLKQNLQRTNTVLAEKDCVAFTNAQILFTAITKVTAPTITWAECLIVLMSATEHLRRSSTELISNDGLHTTSDGEKLQILLVQQQLEENLNKIIQYCRQSIGELDTSYVTTKRRFNNTITYTLKCITTYHKAIDEELQAWVRLPPCDLNEKDIKMLPLKLLKRFQTLYAAIAALVLTTFDCEVPDYVMGYSAVRDIDISFSHIVEEAKQLRSFKDDSTQKKILRHMKRLCESCMAILLGNTEQTEDLCKIIRKLYETCEMLIIYFKPALDGDRDEITNVSEAVCVWIRELLIARGRQPIGRLPEETEKMLRGRRETAAQAMLTIANATRPDVLSPKYSRDVMSAAVDLRLSSMELTSACCSELVGEDEKSKSPVQVAQQQLLECLDKLIQTCRQEQRAGRLGVFIEPRHLGVNKLRRVSSNLKETDDVDDFKHQLLKRLAQLYTTSTIVNPALSDPECVKQARTIFSSAVNVMPQIVKDAFALGKHLDSAVHESMLQQVDQLCDIIKAITANIWTNDIEERMSECSKVSYKLLFTLIPEVDHGPYKEIVNQLALSWKYGYQLSHQAQQITQQVTDEGAVNLNQLVSSNSNAVHKLQTVMQDTDPRLNTPLCITPLTNAVTTLQRSSSKLTMSVLPHTEPDIRQQLDSTLQQLNYSLNRLLQACQYVNTDLPSCSNSSTFTSGAEILIQRRKFDRRLEEARETLSDIYRKFKFGTKPEICVNESEKESLQHQLLIWVTQSDGAVTAFVKAILDHKPPNYNMADQAISTVTTLAPLILQGAHELSAINDGVTNQQTVESVRRLCNACEAIYKNTDDVQVLKENAANFKDAFLKLKFNISTGGYQGPQQVLDMSATAYTRASDLLANVQELDKQAWDVAPVDVNEWEIKTITIAQDFVNIVERLVNDPRSSHCMKSLESIVTKFRRSTSEFIASCTHIQLAGKQRLRTLQEQLNDCLDMALQACREAHENVFLKEQRNEFIKNLQITEMDFEYAILCLQQREVRCFIVESNLQSKWVELLLTVKQIRRDIAIITGDTSKANQTVDEAAEQDILQQFTLLCDLIRTICDNLEQRQDISEAAEVFITAYKSMKSNAVTGTKE